MTPNNSDFKQSFMKEPLIMEESKPLNYIGKGRELPQLTTPLQHGDGL